MEEGKTLPEARIELGMSAEIFEWYAEEGRRAYGRVLPQRASGVRMSVLKEPVGPVAGFAPWNFPLRQSGPQDRRAARGGLHLHSEARRGDARARPLRSPGRCWMRGCPRACLSVVFGVPAMVSAHLIASPIIRAVHFTGSIPVGKQLTKLAAEGMKRTTMELGGHGPVLVFDDVDVEQVLDLAVSAKFRNAGQVCVSPTRFYVHQSLYGKFVEGFTKRTRALKVGDGLVEGMQMGPLAHSRRLDAMQSLLADARQHGAKFHTGGERIAGKGYFFQPTVLSDIPEAARIMNEEPFGPVALINSFSSFEEAISARQPSAVRPCGLRLLALLAYRQSARRTDRGRHDRHQQLPDLGSRVALRRHQGKRPRLRGGHRGTGDLPGHQVRERVLMKSMDKIMALAKRRGFIYQASEIYGGQSRLLGLRPAWARS